jgi:hypothetical protein
MTESWDLGRELVNLRGKLVWNLRGKPVWKERRPGRREGDGGTTAVRK